MFVRIQEEILRLHSIGLLKPLLADKTTKTNIIWATELYQNLGSDYHKDRNIQVPFITGRSSNVIESRVTKSIEQRLERTKKHAEVFTPFWICKKMVSNVDAIWFGQKDMFLDDVLLSGKVQFPKRKKWQHYVDSRRLEITCGEAPYLVNRYDVFTGKSIFLENRQGILDRKLRIVNENVSDEREWLKWVFRAFQATYGYEIQGDNLLIARINLLVSFEEYLFARWRRKPTSFEYHEIIRIIVWNLWQMDGLNGTIPYSKEEKEFYQINSSKHLYGEGHQKTRCKVYDWRRRRSLEYLDIKNGVKKKMKFDFVLGNPPYQDETMGNNVSYAPPIYNRFMDEVYKIGEKVELIHPARFLFQAGRTPKIWNQKMLRDEHFKVMYYEADSKKVFPNTNIKGGIAISYRDSKKGFGAIDTFTPYNELNSILKKVKRKNFISFRTIIVTSYAYHFLNQLYIDLPQLKGKLSKGHEFDLKSNVFEKMEIVFLEKRPQDGREYIRILGRFNNERCYRYIRSDYINCVVNLYNYKVFLPGATGTGQYGEPIATPLLGSPLEGSTETFLSIGKFHSQKEAENAAKYIKCKFTRAMLGILKRTQANTPGKWQWVPLQDFTLTSDIHWSKSISEIDRELYIKYGLNEDEVEFIEFHVKEMA